MLPLAVLTTLPAWADEVAARVRHEPLLAPSSCTGRFVRHSLPHTTRAADRPARAYDTNGAGVALADLDGDRLIDIVLAGLRAPVTVLRNRGGLQFERMELAEAGTRAVAAVDVDGNGRFVPAPEWGLGATESGRGMAFADLDLDGDLDIVNNREAPALLFENRLCGGVGLEADLRWPGSPNRRAIGASVHLATATYPAHRAGRQRLPVQRPRPPPLRPARRRGGPDPHHHLARRRRHPHRRNPPLTLVTIER